MIIKHKDRELLRFDWILPFGVKNLELNTDESQYLPLVFREQARDGVSRALVWKVEDWLMQRTAPMNRRFVRDMLMSLGLNPSDPRYLRHLIEFSKGLSLNDVHWVVPDDFKGSWQACNLYANAFPESIAALAFSGTGKVPHDFSTSPEYTTNGVLAKCWRRTRDGIQLYKAGSESCDHREPFAEFYASQVAEALGTPHVPYHLARYKERLCSVCPLFTSEKQGFIPAGKLLTHDEISKDERFADIFLLDAILLNDDRHLGNFGFLVDHDKNEVCGVAPAFDNGHAFFARPVERFATALPALYEDWAKFPGLDRNKAAAQLTRLEGFRLHKDSRFNLPPKDFTAASDFLSHRIGELRKTFASSTDHCPVKVEFTGQTRLLELIRNNPGFNTAALARLSGLSMRTVKYYLSKLKGRVIFRGAPKTGGYYCA